MRKSICMTVLIALIFSFTQAQAQTRSSSQTKTSEDRETDVYLVGGLGHFPGANTFQVGGGFDTYVYKGLALGGELSETLGGALGGNATILSASGNYHFLNLDKTGRFDPFATGGYSRFFITNNISDFNTLNLGGGLNYWMSQKFGVRFDLSDHINGRLSFIGLRGGIVFTP
ncbi:MAG: hypothetical protein J2P21_07250 [Chloracidobacterium sp.]|nr:hypothetical protein [Chloracidobacterium sp.]